MGMFDYVKVDMPLPDGYMGELQSKDGPCIMCTIQITKTGQMLWPKEFTYEGAFHFYGWEITNSGKFDLHKYVAHFVNGLTDKITQEPILFFE